MSQARPVERELPEGMIHDESTIYGSETYSVEIESAEEARAVQAYVRENSGTTVFLNYQMDAAISRGVREESGHLEDVPDYSRIIGGFTEHIDQGSFGVITSEGCYQDFMTEIQHEVSDIALEEIARGSKDLYLDGDDLHNQPQVVGTSARTDDPHMYGAIWREESPGEKLKQVIKRDEVNVTPEDYERFTHPIKENWGQSLWTQMTDEAERTTAAELLENSGADPSEHEKEGKHDNLSCPVQIGPHTVDKLTPGWEGEEIKTRDLQFN